MKFAIIVNSIFYPLPRTHGMHVRKFFEGFRQNGFVVIEVSSLDEIFDYLGKDSFVYVSNHFLNERNRFTPWDLEKQLFQKIKKSRVRWLLWGFHEAKLRLELANLENVLFLKERFYDSLIDSSPELSFYREARYYELAYSSFIDPRQEYKQYSRIKGCFFAGSKYKVSYNEVLRKISPASLILYYPPKINEIKRISGFTRYTHSLVWHSEANIEKGIIVERFAEAISMGAMIIHDHTRIEKEHVGIHKCFISTSNDLTGLFSNFVWDPDKSRENHEYWRNSDLSYYQQVKNILNEV